MMQKTEMGQSLTGKVVGLDTQYNGLDRLVGSTTSGHTCPGMGFPRAWARHHPPCIQMARQEPGFESQLFTFCDPRCQLAYYLPSKKWG